MKVTTLQEIAYRDHGAEGVRRAIDAEIERARWLGDDPAIVLRELLIEAVDVRRRAVCPCCGSAVG